MFEYEKNRRSKEHSPVDSFRTLSQDSVESTKMIITTG